MRSTVTSASGTQLAEDVFVNMYFTKAGFRRSGDLHDCNQYDVVLRGRTRLRMIVGDVLRGWALEGGNQLRESTRPEGSAQNTALGTADRALARLRALSGKRPHLGIPFK